MRAHDSIPRHAPVEVMYPDGWRACCQPSNVLRVDFARPAPRRRLTLAGKFWAAYTVAGSLVVLVFVSWGYVDAAMQAAGMKP